MGRRRDPFETKAQEYKPSFRLEYRDSRGRILDVKEAFQELSHAFHGHGSGKNKQEKQLRKLKEQEKLRKMSAEDTPLGLAANMRRKQEQTGTAHLVLSSTRT